MPSFSVPAGAGPAGPRHGRRRRVNPDVVRPRPSTAASATPPAHQPPHQDAATTSPPYDASGSPARATEAPTASSRRIGTGKEAPHGDQLPAAGPGPAVGQHIARDTERGPAAPGTGSVVSPDPVVYGPGPGSSTGGSRPPADPERPGPGRGRPPGHQAPWRGPGAASAARWPARGVPAAARRSGWLAASPH